MKKILFLTKNILVDQKFQNELQQLNFEVFCSSLLLEKLLDNTSSFDNLGISTCYEIILLSDTISDKEAMFLLKNLQQYSLPMVRKDNLSPTKKIMEEWSAYGLKGWIHAETTKSEVRELLSNLDYIEENRQKNYQSRLLSVHDGPSFSRLERLLIDILCQSPKQTVSRNELCHKLWESDATNSNLSHLSFLVSKLKKKLELIGFDKECIGTIWGKGYQVTQEVSDWWGAKVELKV
ncbi:winged helix-turn-helix domain-containing protein [Enterococcus sp. AZ196]|uniref:winged helix-turn-helix domain-containing protein n=1 Tax=Enterococcus sp. AZ196 TaxID=2774659 RepID=UPI003D2DD177